MNRAEYPAFATWDLLAGSISKSAMAALLENFVEGLYRAALAHGDTAIDVGAHRARHTIPMAESVGPTGRVFAVEASSVTQKKLLHGISQAPPEVSGVISVIAKAVGESPGSAEFHYVPEAPGMSGLRIQNYPIDVHPVSETVEIVRLDDVIPDHAAIRFIKLDIEGGEFHALKGATSILAKGRPVFVYEWGGAPAAKRFGFSKEEFFGFMETSGYVLYSPLGFRHRPREWGHANAYYFAAIPRERPQDFERVILPATMFAFSRHMAG